MPYIGNTIRAADDYRLIDDISSSFNGSTTSFALQVAGSAPVPFPKSPQQVLISVNGVIQEPDPSGSSGFNLVGTNIVFSSAPTGGHAFFGIIYATADYLNAGGNFPAGSLGAPSITFIGDENTGLYRKGGGSIGFVADATEIANTDSNGLTISSGNLILPDSIIHGGDSDTKIRFPGTDIFSVETGGSERLRVDSSGLKIADKLIHTGDTDTFLEFATDTISLDTGGVERLSLGTTTVFNETGANVDFRIEGDTEANLFYLDAGNDQIGVGTNAPDDLVHLTTAENAAKGLRITNTNNSQASAIARVFVSGGDNAKAAVRLECNGHFNDLFADGNGNFFIEDNGTERMRINSSGNVGIGTTSPSNLLTISAANPVLELTGTASTSGNTFLHINANANHWCVGADNFSSQNNFVIKSGTPASSTHTFLIN